MNLERTSTEEDIEEALGDAEARKIKPNLVSTGKAGDRSGYLLREGDIIRVDNWDDMSRVVANLHDDRREKLDNKHPDKHLTIIPTACEHEYENDDTEFLEATHLVVVNTRNMRPIGKFYYDAERHDYLYMTEEEREWSHQNEEDEEEIEEDEAEFECPFCGKEYEMESYFRDHISECEG